MEVSPTESGLWVLWAKRCVAPGFSIAFGEKGTVLYDGPIAGMAVAVLALGGSKEVGAVWLHPDDASTFMAIAEKMGHPPVKVQ